MKNKEIERVFLVKYLPEGLKNCKQVVIKVGDFCKSTGNNALMIRQKGNKFELIKKEGASLLNRTEHIININNEEFEILWKAVTRSHEKIRLFYSLDDYVCELDIYKGKLSNYARVEVEFKSETEANKFVPPDWFGIEITDINHEIHENLGIISYEDMKKRYNKRNIQLGKIIL